MPNPPRAGCLLRSLYDEAVDIFKGTSVNITKREKKHLGAATGQMDFCQQFVDGLNPNFENFKKGGTLKKMLGWGKPKRGKIFSKIMGGTKLFKLNIGIEKNKNEDF